MVAQSSSIPFAIDGLLALIRGSANVLAQVEAAAIYDGNPTQESPYQTYVVVGEQPMPDAPAVDGTQSFVGFPARERDEEFTIHCAIYSRSGDTDIKAERDRAFGIAAVVERLLRALEVGSDLKLGGAVDWCEFAGNIMYNGVQTQNGALVRVVFGVHCRTRLLGS